MTILLEEPHADDLNTTSVFSRQFEEEVYPADIERAEDPTKTGTSWSQPEDKSINRYGRTACQVVTPQNKTEQYKQHETNKH